jgi:hypothetical protein
LFLDDGGVADRRRLVRTVHAARKHSEAPILFPEPPWEGAMVPSSVLYDEDERRFKMWYQTHARLPGVESTYVSCFATSVDGVHWDRPEVGAYDFEGSRANNLCLGNTPGGMGVIKDDRDPDPARRFKALFWRGGNRSPADEARGFGANERRGFYAASSPDGARWTLAERNPVLTGTGDTESFFGWDDRYEAYVAFVRPGRDKDAGRATPRRVIGRSISADFDAWSAPVAVHLPDASDPPLAELYYMPVQVFGDYYVGIPHVYVPSPDPFGPFWPELAVSRDGIRWSRLGEPGRRRLVWPGPEGSFDSGMIRCARGILERGDELWIYYGGWHEDHGVSRQHRHMTTPREAQRKAAAIGLAKLRRDGFVSLDAGDVEGSLTTTPFGHTGTGLTINACVTGEGGFVRAALVDPEGRPIPGFGPYDMAPLTGDDTGFRVHWSGEERPERLRGQPVAVLITMRRAELYSLSL